MGSAYRREHTDVSNDTDRLDALGFVVSSSRKNPVEHQAHGSSG
jgi:hypothetical protein